MKIEAAGIEDAHSILTLQKLAFISEAEIYDDFEIAPLKQTLESICEDFEKQVFLKACVDGRIVGSVRGYMDEGTCVIGRLVVHPEFQNLGIGRRLMNGIESFFGEAERYELFTGHRSERNLSFYGKLGYRACKTERINDKLELVLLEKRPDAG